MYCIEYNFLCKLPWCVIIYYIVYLLYIPLVPRSGEKRWRYASHSGCTLKNPAQMTSTSKVHKRTPPGLNDTTRPSIQCSGQCQQDVILKQRHCINNCTLAQYFPSRFKHSRDQNFPEKVGCVHPSADTEMLV